jgi:hypothetical protein
MQTKLLSMSLLNTVIQNQSPTSQTDSLKISDSRHFADVDSRWVSVSLHSGTLVQFIVEIKSVATWIVFALVSTLYCKPSIMPPQQWIFSLTLKFIACHLLKLGSAHSATACVN